MRSIILIFLASFSLSAVAQNPVTWKYTTRKIAEKTYEVHITANVADPWHIYSQSTPEGGPVATQITFRKNPLVTTVGVIKENGKLRTKYEEVFGVDVKFFDGAVDFVQIINLKLPVKTNLTGSIEFMLCNDHECMPPATVPFSIPIN